MAVSAGRSPLVDCCVLLLNIFDFKMAPSLIVKQSCCNFYGAMQIVGWLAVSASW